MKNAKYLEDQSLLKIIIEICEDENRLSNRITQYFESSKTIEK